MNYLLTILFLFGTISRSVGQDQPLDVMEEVFLHINDSELISGETLLFSAYVRSVATGKPSPLSTILYVELVDTEGIPVYQTKIKLHSGRGQGDYFVSSLLSTGTYHLVAYTRWMKNFNQFFYQPVTIINPFEEFKASIAKEDPVKVTFYPEGGTLRAGSRNKVAIRTIGSSGLAVQVNGRIMSADGVKVADIETGSEGIGGFTITPQVGLAYQAIMEGKDGNFVFYDLPASCSDCSQIRVSETSTGFLITMEGNEFSGRLVISDRQNKWINTEVSIPGQLSISKKDLPIGLLNVKLYDENDALLNSRLVFNGTLQSGKIAVNSRYGLREKVTASFDLNESGSFSISVKKVNGVHRPIGLTDGFILTEGLANPPVQRPTSDVPDELLIMSEANFREIPGDTVQFMPELRSDLFNGRVRDAEGVVPVSISLPGDDFQFQTVYTSEEGYFTIGVTPVFTDQNAFYKVLNESGNYEISIDNEFYPEYRGFKDRPITFDSVRVQQIIERSINNQIDNAYYAFQGDSILTGINPANQFENTRSYRLNDYTRFPTLRDTFIEYIPEVGVRKNESNYQMKIRLLNRFPGEDFMSLVLLDGLPVQPAQVMDLSPYAIETINVLNHRFYFGDLILDGILSFETIDGNYAGIDPKGVPIQLKGLQFPKKYCFPDHSTNSTLPDRRDQLFWDPVVSANGSYTFDFYTSDVPGTYEIRVEGISDTGEPISLRNKFIVGK